MFFLFLFPKRINAFLVIFLQKHTRHVILMTFHDPQLSGLENGLQNSMTL